MKVKIFTVGIGNDESKESIEEEVNRFLKEYPDVDSKDIRVNTCAGINDLGRAFVNATVTIFYEG